MIAVSIPMHIDHMICLDINFIFSILTIGRTFLYVRCNKHLQPRQQANVLQIFVGIRKYRAFPRVSSNSLLHAFQSEIQHESVGQYL